MTKANEYQGETKDGVPHGRGTMLFANGSRYVGDWQDGEFYGQGTLVTRDGTYGRPLGKWRTYLRFFVDANRVKVCRQVQRNEVSRQRRAYPV